MMQLKRAAGVSLQASFQRGRYKEIVDFCPEQ